MKSNTEGWSNKQLNDRIQELEEKVEKWNELCDGLEYGVNTPVEDVLQEINLINRDNELRRNTLEVVKEALVKMRKSIQTPVMQTVMKVSRGWVVANLLEAEKILEGGG